MRLDRFGERVQLIGSTDPEADTRPHVALMSLPRLFGTELHTIPLSAHTSRLLLHRERPCIWLSPRRDFGWHRLGFQSRQQGHVSP